MQGEFRLRLALIILLFLLSGTGCDVVGVLPAVDGPLSDAAPTAEAAPTNDPVRSNDFSRSGRETAVREAVATEGGQRPTAATNPTVTPTPVPVAGGRSIGDPYIPELGNTGYFVQRYTLQMALDPSVIHVNGQTTIEAISSLDGLAELSLDFAGFEITALTVDGQAAAHYREGKKLIVALPQPLPAGRPFTLAIDYSGQPIREASPYLGIADYLGLVYPGNGTIYTVSQPDGARYWFPANDHPRDKAFFRFEITVPAGLTAVANGRLVEERAAAMPGGAPATTFVWEHSAPMATYLALVAVGNYTRLDDVSPGGVRLRHYLFPGLLPGFQETMDQIDGALAWLGEQFGAYPFESFGYVTATIPRVSMETQTMVLLSEGMVSERIMIHELSHMWFGNWVSLDSWGEMWRNEGFATYVEFLWLNRDSPENLALEMAALEVSVAENSSGAPLNNLPPDQLFGFESYNRGALMAHKLRQEVGDDAFFRGLRLYFARYGGSTASDAEFQAVMEEVSGRSLEGFFAEWVGR